MAQPEGFAFFLWRKSRSMWGKASDVRKERQGSCLITMNYEPYKIILFILFFYFLLNLKEERQGSWLITMNYEPYEIIWKAGIRKEKQEEKQKESYEISWKAYEISWSVYAAWTMNHEPSNIMISANNMFNMNHINSFIYSWTLRKGRWKEKLKSEVSVYTSWSMNQYKDV